MRPLPEQKRKWLDRSSLNNHVVAEAVCAQCGYPIQKLQRRLCGGDGWVRGKLRAEKALICHFREYYYTSVGVHTPREGTVREPAHMRMASVPSDVPSHQ